MLKGSVEMYPRLTLEERRRFEAIRLRHEGAMFAGVRFGLGAGQEPTSPAAPSPGYYELSQDDRALIETVLKDNQSPDANRAQIVMDHWNAALIQAAPRFGALGVSLYAGQTRADDSGSTEARSATEFFGH